MKRYYQLLKVNGNTQRISQVEKFLEATRLPNTITKKLFDFLYFGGGGKYDYSDHSALDEITQKIEREARRRHQLSDEETILFYRKRKDSVTFVVTDYGFSWRNNSGDSDYGAEYFYIPWESVHRVEYDEDYRIEFYSSSSKEPFLSRSGYSVIKDTDDEKCRLFAELLTSIARYCFYRDRDELYRKKVTDNSLPFLDRLKASEMWLTYCVEYPECLDALFSKVDILLSEYRNTNNVELLDSAEDVLDGIPVADDLKFKEKGDKFAIKPAWLKLEYDITKEENDAVRNRVRRARVEIACLKGKWQEARQNVIRILGSNGVQEKRELIKLLGELESDDNWQNYTSAVDYHRRKFIMPLKEIAGCNSDTIDVFQIDHLPSCIDFPVGHPVAGTVYIGNPFVPNMYKPFEGYEYEFFLSKVNEYCRLLQCLGATEISIRTLKGKSASGMTASNVHVDGSAGSKRASFSAEVNYRNQKRQEASSLTEMEIVQRFAPMRKPYVPDGLVWYKEEVDWQSKVQQRLNGNMLEFSQRISTKETSFVAATEILDIKAQAALLWKKANINVDIKSESEFKSSEETEWLVSVKFKSLDEFTDTTSCDNEDKYKEEVLFYLEDNGIVTDIERHYLEKKRVRLGITAERAKEIEETCLQQN